MNTNTKPGAVPHYFEKTLQSLLRELNKAEQRTAGKRKIRRLKRQIDFCNAYLLLLQECLTVIAPFHPHPIYLVNRFWTDFNTWDNFCDGIYPSGKDFFSWYFDSKTIEAEIAEPLS